MVQNPNPPINSRRGSIKPLSRPTTASAVKSEILKKVSIKEEIPVGAYTGLILDQVNAVTIKQHLQRKETDAVWAYMSKLYDPATDASPSESLRPQERTSDIEDSDARREMIVQYSLEALLHGHKTLDLDPFQLSVWLTILKASHDRFTDVIANMHQSTSIDYAQTSAQAFQSVMEQYVVGVPIPQHLVEGLKPITPFTWKEIENLASYHVNSYVQQSKLIAYVFRNPQEIARTTETRSMYNAVIPPLSEGIDADQWEEVKRTEREKQEHEALQAAEKTNILKSTVSIAPLEPIPQSRAPVSEQKSMRPLTPYTAPIPVLQAETLFPSSTITVPFIDPNFVTKTITHTAASYMQTFQQHLEKRLQHQERELQARISAIEAAMAEKESNAHEAIDPGCTLTESSVLLTPVNSKKDKISDSVANINHQQTLPKRISRSTNINTRSTRPSEAPESPQSSPESTVTIESSFKALTLDDRIKVEEPVLDHSLTAANEVEFNIVEAQATTATDSSTDINDTNVSKNTEASDTAAVDSSTDTNDTKGSKKTAALLPVELLLCIFAYFAPPATALEECALNQPRDSSAALLASALVCKRWAVPAIKTMWRRPMIYDVQRFAKLVHTAEESALKIIGDHSSEDITKLARLSTTTTSFPYVDYLCQLSLSNTLAENQRNASRLSVMLPRLLLTTSMSKALTLLDLSFAKGVSNYSLLRCATNLSNLLCLNISGGNRSEIVVLKVADCCRSLKKLSLAWNEQVGDFAMVEIGKKVKHLEWLDVTGCIQLSDAGVIAFSKSQAEEHETLCTDASSSYITPASSPRASPYASSSFNRPRTPPLKYLSLSYCKDITGQGILGAAGYLPALNVLNIVGCENTSSAMIELHDQRPTLQINRPFVAMI
ncbi:hypothetical protein SmJEL517_g02109 [Synchytrium microbalum]|uniref:F-box domain-containing protein n=1 Tax=Synchytrium microbalum TaxID=1806994 RepID=A0A507CC48_9FUNG|nr:uncharacterized protein SmJEL517_g02109 [Synchytrium microbalum]TPX35596.1 hypothetical protein SmJEL517_g02109 [Synchytrium microbalum]